MFLSFWHLFPAQPLEWKPLPLTRTKLPQGGWRCGCRMLPSSAVSQTLFKRMQEGLFFFSLKDSNPAASLLSPLPGRHHTAVLLVLTLCCSRVMLPAPNSRAVIWTAGKRHLGSCRLLLFFFHNNDGGISYPLPPPLYISKSSFCSGEVSPCTKTPVTLQ